MAKAATVMEVENINKVPMKQWRKWSNDARKMFNRLYALVEANPEIVSGINTAKPDPQEWETLAWNVAWLAAAQVDVKD